DGEIDLRLVLEDEDRGAVAHGLDALQDVEAAVLADADVHHRDVGTAAVDGGEESGRIHREAGLEAFEPKQHAQCFAGCSIGIENMDEDVPVQKGRIVKVLCHSTPPTDQRRPGTCHMTNARLAFPSKSACGNINAAAYSKS